MARPTKQGIDYFPLDVGFFEDIKIRRLKKDCGNQAISILVAILCCIYRDEGYYVGVNSDLTFLIAEMFGVSEDAVEETVRKAVTVGIFDEAQFHSNDILTSRGIQERYFSATRQRSRVNLVRSFLINSVSIPDNAVFIDGNEVSNADNPQSKVKESKVKESIYIKSGKPDDAFLGGTYEEGDQPEGNTKPEEEPPSYDAVVSYLNEKAGTRYLSSSKATQRLIHARWKEGFRLKEFETAIDKKVAEWKGTDMEQYLRPATLFGTKFESYLNQPLVKAADKQRPKYNYKSDNVGNFEQRHYTEKDLDGLVAGPDNWEALDRMILNQRAKNKANKKTSSE